MADEIADEPRQQPSAGGIGITHEGRDSVFTTLTEGLSMLGMVLVYKLAVLHSKQDLDLYVIVRRTIAFAFPVVLVGTMVGLTRFVSMSADPAANRKKVFLRPKRSDA